MKKDDVSRAYRAVRLIKSGAQIAARNGIGSAGTRVALKTLGKATIVFAVADAVISVAEAVGAWSAWQTAKQDTVQLRTSLETARVALAADVEHLRVELKMESQRLDDRKRVLRLCDRVRRNSMATLETVRSCLDMLGTHNEQRAATFQALIQSYEDAALQYRRLAEDLDS